MENEKDNSVNSTHTNLTQHLFTSAAAAQGSEARQKDDAQSQYTPAAPAGGAPDWGQWLIENGARMLLFARQQTRTSEDAEDVLQDALVKLARKVEEGSFLGGQESWRPFLYTTIRRLAIDLGRKNDRRVTREKKSEADRQTETGGLADPWLQ